MSETLATDTTQVRFLTAVNPQVLPQSRPIRRNTLSETEQGYTLLFVCENTGM